METNTHYTTTSTIEEVTEIATGKTKVVSNINRTKISKVARELTHTKIDAIRLARQIRYYLLLGNPLKQAVIMATQGNDDE
jgi:hypothetical protein